MSQLPGNTMCRVVTQPSMLDTSRTQQTHSECMSTELSRYSAEQRVLDNMVKGNLQEVACRKVYSKSHGEHFRFHIPKTGGYLKLCYSEDRVANDPDFHYRHINKCTASALTQGHFNLLNYDKYLEYNLFTMLRNPVDHVISEVLLYEGSS